MQKGLFGALAASALLLSGMFTEAVAAPLSAIAAKPLQITSIQLQALRAARARPEALALRTSIRALAARQPDLSKRVDFAAVDTSAVPVLVSPAKLETLRVINRSDHYTAVTQMGDAVVTIDGTRNTASLPEGQKIRVPARNIRLVGPQGAPPAGDSLDHVRVQQTISGISVSFMRFGHLYDLSIDCPDAGKDDPEAVKPDPDDLARIKKRFGDAPASSQCTEANALAIAQQLQVLGGGAP